jgi:SAM-dependent methyltransferase/uncharacterized protein YbaR (Trm112 family)
MNVKVKFREGFRPFAPAVLREEAGKYFDVQDQIDSPYMLLVAPVREERRTSPTHEQTQLSGIDKLKVCRSEIPAVTHVDYSARIQTVDRERHGLYCKLLESFHRLTGCPVVINTSFNLGWDPIVCTPAEAYSTFMASDIDLLCMGPFLIHKRRQTAWVEDSSVDFLDEALICPCGSAAPLRRTGDALWADACQHRFPITDHIPQMFWSHAGGGNSADVTEKVKAFYEETPFPNYDEHESIRSLIEKSRRGRYAQALDEAIPYNASVLEVGCGTGQLSNFLGISCRRVIGADLCLNSLRLGEGFRRKHHLNRVRFVQMNLFRPPFRPGEFDVILCNGVLHHTSNPHEGFQRLVPLLRPGGHIVVGLYNKFGRLMTDLRRGVFHMTKGAAKSIDPYLRSVPMSEDKQRAWFADQYLHPHESKHTIDEVLGWVEQAGLEFVRGVPSVTSRKEDPANVKLFNPSGSGTRWDHLAVQARQIVTGSREGGFFVMIARRPER